MRRLRRPTGGTWWRGALLLAAVLALVVWKRPGSPRARAVPERVVALQPWDVFGCYRLSTRPWGPASRGRVPDSLLARAARAGRTSSPAEPPTRVLLLPDSADRWGRVLSSFRARTLEAGRHPGRSLRWLVRADTLWVLWSDGDVRGGVALRPAGDSLAGRARARGDSLDLGARAVGWRMNCATGAREAWHRHRTR